MENTETMVQTAAPYNPNQLVTYKVINNGEATYPTSKVVDIEWQLENARSTDRQLSSLRLSVSNLEDMLPKWLEDETGTEEIVSDICQLFGFNPTKDIEFEATITVSGTITVPLAEIADFDIDNVDLNVDINSYSHDVDVTDISVDSITSL
jgi:hypothetical protein